MADNEVERGRAKQDWFLEHGSIQAELMKLKKEAMRQREEKEGREVAPANEVGDKSPVATDPSPTGTSRDRECPQVETSQEKPNVDRVEEVVKEVQGEDGDVKNPRLPGGKIPTSPDLSQKIASVIQLENKLKRRKYEMEKSNKQKATSPQAIEDVPKEGHEEDLQGTGPIVPMNGPNHLSERPEPMMTRQTENEGPLDGPVKGKVVPSLKVEQEATGTDRPSDPGLGLPSVPGPTATAEVQNHDPLEAPSEDSTETRADLPEAENRTDKALGTDEEGPHGDDDLDLKDGGNDDGIEEGNDLKEEMPEGNGRLAERSPKKKKRKETGSSDRAWLEGSARPRRPADRGERESPSPLGRILNIFKRKGK